MPDTEQRWQATWTQAMTDFRTEDEEPLDGITVRTTVPVSLGGTAVRLQLSNAFGDAPVRVGAAAVTRDGDTRRLTHHGEAAFAISPGTAIRTDPVDLSLTHGDELTIDLHLPEPTPAATLGGFTFQRSPPGDFTGSPDFPAPPAAPRSDPQTDWVLPAGGPFLRAVEVLAPPAAAVIACLGASITTLGWPQMTSARLGAEARIAVVNRGIPGNRLRTDALPSQATWGRSGLSRFADDVLDTAGVTHVAITYSGNDISLPGSATPPGELPTAEQLIGAYDQLIDRATDAGLGVVLATMTPLPPEQLTDPVRTTLYRTVTEWLTHAGLPIADFNIALTRPEDRTRLAPRYDVGDHIHPNRNGQRRLAETMAEAITVWL